MLSQSKIKLIHSLERKKSRKETGLFVAEGPKVVGDLLEIMTSKLIVANDEWLKNNGKKGFGANTEVIPVSDQELKKASFLQHPQQVLALFPIPNPVFESGTAIFESRKSLFLALDGVQDPGNLGTIIRIADWFGIEDIFCSHETVDAYSPKVVQATMGSIARVRLHYVDLKQLIESLPKDYPVYGTLLDGENIYKQELSSYGMIVMGNEGNGISPEIRKLVNNHLLIPNYPEGRKTADSLNVAIATAITCAAFRRKG